ELPSERLPLSQCTGAVLREAVIADRDQPPFDRVTMDGVAIAYQDFLNGTRRFRIVGMQGAGAAPLKLEQPGQCVQIMTGAVLAQGSDTVVPVERVQIADGWCELRPDAAPAMRQFIHPRGS